MFFIETIKIVFLFLTKSDNSLTDSIFFFATCAFLFVMFLSYVYFNWFSHGEFYFNVFYIIFFSRKGFCNCIVNSGNILNYFPIFHTFSSNSQFYTSFFCFYPNTIVYFFFYFIYFFI